MCRNEQDLRNEQDYLTKVLQYNGYPRWAINKGRQRCDKKISNTQDKGSNVSSASVKEKNRSFVVMDYIKGLSERIRDIFKRKGVQVYFKSSNTLRRILVSPKDKDPKCNKQDVIYHIPCASDSCNATYIGETCRVLHERIKDHTVNPNSAIRQHHVDTGHPLPTPDDSDIKILSVEPNGFKRRVKEAIFIKTNNPYLNQNVGKYNFPPIYDQLLAKAGGRTNFSSKNR